MPVAHADKSCVITDGLLQLTLLLQLAFNTRFAKNWFWRQQSFGADLSEGVASWNHLPQDLLLRIGQNLGDEDRQVLGCCCSAWKNAIGQSTKHASFVWAGRQERDNLDCQPMVTPSWNRD